MTPTTIILSIIIIVLIYVLYAYVTGTVTTMKPTASLNTGVPPITKIEGARNTRYGYSLWLYVNTWDSNIDKVIFSRNENIKLYLDKTSPTLKLDLAMDTTKTDDKNADKKVTVYETMIITNNFPLQKWVSIAVSVDNQFADVYLDGKLVKSQRFYINNTGGNNGIQPKIPPAAESNPVMLGDANTSFDAFVTEFKRWTVPIDPESAWDNYLAGNGTNSISRAFSAYGIDVAVLKSGVEQTRFSF